MIKLDRGGDSYMDELHMKTLFSYYNPNNQVEYFAQAVYNNELVPDYYVSNYGRVWCTRLKRFLRQSPDKDGYLRVSLVIHGKSKTIKVHRLVMMTFHPIANPDDFIVNHRDVNVQHNWDTNLEWTTVMGNTRYGWDVGSNKNRGSGNVRTVVKEEDVHTICQLLEQGNRPCEICDHFGITDKKERMRFSAIASGIAHYKSFRHISKDYNIKGSKGMDRYRENFAYFVCEFLYSDIGYTDEEIAQYLNISDEDFPKFKVYLNDLRRGRTEKDVMRYYEQTRGSIFNID